MKYAIPVVLFSSIIVMSALKHGNIWLMFFAGIPVGVAIAFLLVERELSKYK